MAKVIYIPSLTDNPEVFNKLFEIWLEMLAGKMPVEMDFSKCGFLGHSAVALLGGMASTFDIFWNVQFRLETMSKRVKKGLQHNGFLDFFGEGSSAVSGDSVPFRHFEAKNRDELIQYLKDDWLKLSRIDLSEQLRYAIVGKVLEIYDNAFEHAKSPTGVFSCGQFYKKKKMLKLTVLDFGMGIPENVCSFKGNESFQPDVALRWAFQPCNTTRPGVSPRGSGLELFKALAKVNDCSVEVFSQNSYGRIDSDGELFQTTLSSFPGTVFNIAITCDDLHYQFVSESLPTGKETLF